MVSWPETHHLRHRTPSREDMTGSSGLAVGQVPGLWMVVVQQPVTARLYSTSYTEPIRYSISLREGIVWVFLLAFLGYTDIT